MNTLLLLVLIVGIFFILKWISVHLEDSCATVAHRLSIPATVAGASLLAISSSAPEFFTSLSSALFQGVFQIGLITIIWSAIFNILVLPGVAAFYVDRTLPITKNGLSRDIIYYIIIVILLILFILDQQITRKEALVFILFYFSYIFVLFFQRKRMGFFDPIRKADAPISKIIMSFTLGIGTIGLLCWAMIEAGLQLADNLNIPIAIISVLVFAIGTSLPDLFLSIAAAKNKNASAAISNAFGSNTFDIAISLGVPILIVGTVDAELKTILSSIIMLLISVIFSSYFILKDWRMTKAEGFVCISLFVLMAGLFIIGI